MDTQVCSQVQVPFVQVTDILCNHHGSAVNDNKAKVGIAELAVRTYVTGTVHSTTQHSKTDCIC